VIRLHPQPEARHECPFCQVTLDVQGWYIPGMRTLAVLTCPACKGEFFGDLPAGHGLYYPMLLHDGKVYDSIGVPWFADWLRISYANRTSSPVGFITEDMRPLRRPILLNCLDKLYGHCVLKLLNAQYYLDHRPEFDLVVLVPRFLRWMVPNGVAAIWTVDLPLNRGSEWNDWLAIEVRRRIEPWPQCWLSVALSHPHPEDYDIERFTRVRPFPIVEWEQRLDRPTITFIWREDRPWGPPSLPLPVKTLRERLKRRFGFARDPRAAQTERVLRLADGLKALFPQIDFGVAGLGKPGGFPGWITDLRTSEIADEVERVWCLRYAQSHVVIGVHGSNMLLPSGHAGATIELVPDDRWGNLAQDILTSARDGQEMLFRCRFLPLAISPVIFGTVTASLISDLPYVLLNFSRPWNDHAPIRTDPLCIVQTRRKIMAARSLRP
jgi:hypothetical protein